MSDDVPTPVARHARPGPDARRTTLGLGVAPTSQETFAASLARIPDLSPGESIDVEAPPAPTVDSKPRDGTFNTAEKVALRAVLAEPSAIDPNAPPPDPFADPDLFTTEAPPSSDVPEESAASSPVVAPARRRPPMWRRIAFAVTLLALLAAIPVLAIEGRDLVLESTDGQFAGAELRPSDPGYEAQVDPTPTAVAVLYTPEGIPSAATYMALGGESGGGTVVFVPLETEVSEPAYGVNTLRRAYDVVADRPAEARERISSQVGRLFNTGIIETIDLGNDGLSQLVAPVAPLRIQNPEPITLPDGSVIPSGATELAAEQVGPYLEVRQDFESDLNRLNRHEVVWAAWIDAVRQADRPDAVPGETNAGIGRFVRSLAAGDVTFTTMPVDEIDDGAGAKFRVDQEAVTDIVADAVPAPLAATPGSRFTVRLLNGVEAGAVPGQLVRQIVRVGGTTTILGNGPEFGTDETYVVYANPADETLAQVVLSALGGTGEARLDPEAPDSLDLTIVVGEDILGDLPSEEN